MVTLLPTPNLDKETLIQHIKEKFLHINEFKYHRTIAEFTNDQGDFIGDNFWETVFRMRPNKSPIIYEFGGPYDVFSNDYGEAARVWDKAQIVFEFDIKNGIIQRTAAMATAYLLEIKHSPINLLFYGTGKVNSSVLDYLHHFFPEIKTIDYIIHKELNHDFENKAQNMGISSTGIQEINLPHYDTIIMAKNKGDYIITPDVIRELAPGTVLLSLSTTGTADISPDVYKDTNVDLFIDDQITVTAFSDMKEVMQQGDLGKSIDFSKVLKEGLIKNPNHITVIRIAGHPLQDIAITEMILSQKQIIID